MKHIILLLALSIYSGISIHCQNNSQIISIEIKGIRNDQGKAGIALFAGEDGFPMNLEKAIEVRYISIQDSSASFIFLEIPEGEYAITVFHDENLNGEIETNFIGMPKEGVGVSNNPKPRMGAPRYEACKFHTDTLNNLIISMRYIGQ